jgi:hypothetical protein
VNRKGSIESSLELDSPFGLDLDLSETESTGSHRSKDENFVFDEEYKSLVKTGVLE